MDQTPLFTEGQLEGIARALGNTDRGLTGSEIGLVLSQCRIPDPGSTLTKWKRLYQALSEHQERTTSGKGVVAFIEAAMNPARYTEAQPKFNELRYRLNKGLLLCGLALTENGKVVECDTAATLTEAQERASRLMAELERRGVHEGVLRFCRDEWDGEDYFHAVLEATKSVAERIRDLTGLKSDGAKLAEDAFGVRNIGLQRLAINGLSTETEASEHRGFASLVTGLFQMFRNPTAHEPRILRQITEAEALDVLSLASYLHRRLDGAIASPKRGDD